MAGAIVGMAASYPKKVISAKPQMPPFARFDHGSASFSDPHEASHCATWSWSANLAAPFSIF
ncbi:MAG: hypothetical protein ACOY8P_04120, partial [Thermodesulfobacteriota bacterium]